MDGPFYQRMRKNDSTGCFFFMNLSTALPESGIRHSTLPHTQSHNHSQDIYFGTLPAEILLAIKQLLSLFLSICRGSSHSQLTWLAPVFCVTCPQVYLKYSTVTATYNVGSVLTSPVPLTLRDCFHCSSLFLALVATPIITFLDRASAPLCSLPRICPIFSQYQVLS